MRHSWIQGLLVGCILAWGGGISFSTSAWAQEDPVRGSTPGRAGGGVRSGGGGSAIGTDAEKTLADYFLRSGWEPYVYDEEVRAELKALEQLTQFLGFGIQDLWPCDIWGNWCAANQLPPEFRIVDRLPIEMLVQVDPAHSSKALKAYGYTSAGDFRHLTYLTREFLTLPNPTDRALAILHERLHAYANPPEEHIAWMTTGLRRLRDYQRGLIPFDASLGDYLRRFTASAQRAITRSATGASLLHREFSVHNDGKCLVFSGSKKVLPGSVRVVFATPDGAEQDCAGLVNFPQGFEAFGEDNLVRVPLAEGENPYLVTVRAGAVSVKGKGNRLSLHSVFRGSILRVSGNDNRVEDALEAQIEGDGNAIARVAHPIRIQGSKNTATSLRGNHPTHLAGSGNTITRSSGTWIRGDSNSVEDLEINGDPCVPQATQAPTCGIHGDDNSVARISKSSALRIVGARNRVSALGLEGVPLEIDGSNNELSRTQVLSNRFGIQVRGDSNQILDNESAIFGILVDGSQNRVIRSKHSTFSILGSSNHVEDSQFVEIAVTGQRNQVTGSRHDGKGRTVGSRIEVRANDCVVQKRKGDLVLTKDGQRKG